MKIPVATYRLQFNSSFRFEDASALVEYLRDLGISDVYASPLFEARSGSTHGYDITDPSRINPEIGSPEEFESFTDELREREMGLLLDIVPNHMAASLENPWWHDVLERGQQSSFAGYFDIDWSTGKVLIPILGKPYGDVLESGELVLRRFDGRIELHYYDHHLPVRADAELAQFIHAHFDSINGIPGEPSSFDRLDYVLSKQAYRIAYWRKAADAINYRRFFDISDLIGLHAWNDNVFAATHAYTLRLVEQQRVTGLRIDHIDGLLDPKSYLDRLPAVHVIVEKILAQDEALPEDWKTHGTSGYEFLNIVNGVFVDPAGYLELLRVYSDFTGLGADQASVFRAGKRQVIRKLFAGEAHVLSHRLLDLAAEDRQARDLSRDEVTEALISVTACLPIYRTYIRDFNVSAMDRTRIETAAHDAAEYASTNAIQFLRRVLLLDPPHYLRERRSAYLDFVRDWQQFTGPVMAKGLEDTTFYVFNPLLSLNEVGGDALAPSAYFGVEEFHRRNQDRQRRYPLALNATSTHDTKRSEDVRARINVLSEMPYEWERRLVSWAKRNPAEIPDRNEQCLLYQTLVGAWPISRDRMQQFAVKALREGKTHSSWTSINEEYERGVLEWIDNILKPDPPEFLKQFERFQRRIAYFGALNSLSQAILKITCPGIPDFYQGSETWDFSVTDPDNRRPVDFDARRHMQQRMFPHDNPREFLRRWEDGRIKMFVIRRLLGFRRRHASLFVEGRYTPVPVSGPLKNHAIAFARESGDKRLLVVVPRLTSQITLRGRHPIGRLWKNTSLDLPWEPSTGWANVLTGEPANDASDLSALFSTLPFAVLFHS